MASEQSAGGDGGDVPESGLRRAGLENSGPAWQLGTDEHDICDDDADDKAATTLQLPPAVQPKRSGGRKKSQQSAAPAVNPAAKTPAAARAAPDAEQAAANGASKGSAGAMAAATPGAMDLADGTMVAASPVTPFPSWPIPGTPADFSISAAYNMSAAAACSNPLCHCCNLEVIPGQGLSVGGVPWHLVCHSGSRLLTRAAEKKDEEESKKLKRVVTAASDALKKRKLTERSKWVEDVLSLAVPPGQMRTAMHRERATKIVERIVRFTRVEKEESMLMLNKRRFKKYMKTEEDMGDSSASEEWENAVNDPDAHVEMENGVTTVGVPEPKRYRRIEGVQKDAALSQSSVCTDPRQAQRRLQAKIDTHDAVFNECGGGALTRGFRYRPQKAMKLEDAEVMPVLGSFFGSGSPQRPSTPQLVRPGRLARTPSASRSRSGSRSGLQSSAGGSSSGREPVPSAVVTTPEAAGAKQQ